MLLQLSSTYSTPLGIVEMTVAINSQGTITRRWKSDFPAEPITDADVRRLIQAYKDVGYHARREDQPGKKGGEPVRAIRIGLTQSYQVSHLLMDDSMEVALAVIDNDPSLDDFREICGVAVSLWRRLAPASKVFSELAEVYQESDQAIRKAITDGLRSITRASVAVVAAVPLLSIFM